MKNRLILLGLSVMVLGGVAWLRKAEPQQPAPPPWQEITPGIWRTSTQPHGYALVDGDHALLIDAPRDTQGLPARIIDEVVLTHYHRGVCAAVGGFLNKGVPVRALQTAAPWLTVEGVRKYWQEAIPLRGSRTAYLVVPEGFAGIDTSLKDGQKITWRGWELQVIGTPGHALAHAAVAARKGQGKEVIFCGGALAEAGKLWAPYTTDWDHWTDAGLTPTAKSLRLLAARKPDMLCPSYGPVIAKEVDAALAKTAAAVEEVAFLKSFERFTKKRLGNAPEYRFLAKEQAQSGGEKPWSQVSPHLFLTGNTYVLTSRDNTCLMIDPWDKRSAAQWLKLQKERNFGPLEVVMFSHAHYDHYDGIYYLPERDKLQVWTLDWVAAPLAEPFLLRAPFLDARPIRFDRQPRDGDTLAWREYRFRFHHLPGQTEFTMGVETVIDGKRCFFTADNFFHQDMFSGSGGWMGLNRSFPPMYAASAQKVLDAAPEWVLAEHGGPFEFSAEDFRRRVAWGNASAATADAVCLSGQHRCDWDPHRVHVEPLLQKARPGNSLKANWVLSNPLPLPEKTTIVLEGRGLTAGQTWVVEAKAHGTSRRAFTLQLPNDLRAGRHIFPLRITVGDKVDGSDAFLAVDVGQDN